MYTYNSFRSYQSPFSLLLAYPRLNFISPFHSLLSPTGVVVIWGGGVLKVDGALVLWHTFKAMVGKEDMASGGLTALSPWSDWAQVYSQPAFTLGILTGRSFFLLVLLGWTVW